MPCSRGQNVKGAASPPRTTTIFPPATAMFDRSGSMAGDELEATKACAAYLARRLGPTDELAVIAYDDEVRLELPLGRSATNSSPSSKPCTGSSPAAGATSPADG
jgi:Ca-activated chloride channel family protein